MTRKWKDNRGETLVEVLASILIGVLSVALLFSAVMASANIDKKAKKTDEAFNAALNAAEAQEGAINPFDSTVPEGTAAKVTVIGENLPSYILGSPKTVTVNFFGGDGALSYEVVKEPGP